MHIAVAIDRLQALESELRSAGLTALYLFGSVARDEGGDASDVDLLFEAAEDRSLSLIDQARLQRKLGEALGTGVDLLERSALRPAIRRMAESDMLRIF
jgi:predicted nucleotidyltransferase